MSVRVYFIHPVNTYDTDLEREFLERLSVLFPEPAYSIVNPNENEHSIEYKKRARNSGNGMSYFIELANSCYVGAVLLFSDGKIGAGMGKEINTLLSAGKRVFVLDNRNKLRHIDEKWSERVLSIEDTRLRVYNKDGTIRTYC